MRSVSSLGVRSARRTAVRYAMTALGASLGVAVLFSVLSLNASIDRSLQRSLGPTAVPSASVEGLGAYGQRLPADALDRAARLPEVRHAFGAVWFPTVFAHGQPNEEELWIRGHELREGPRADDPYPNATDTDPDDFVVAGRDPAPAADEVSLSEVRARELGVAHGDMVTVAAPTGPVALQVVRIVEGEDRAGYTSVETARRLADLPTGYTDVGVNLAAGTNAAAWVDRHASSVGEGLTLRTGHGDELRDIVSAIRSGFGAVAFVALFVGGFLVYLTMTMSVAERTKTWGTLRAVGATRADVMRAVLAEAAVLAVVATVAGALLGVVFATGLSRLVGDVYDVPVQSIVITPFVVVAAGLVGLVIPPVAAFLPAWRAASAEPIEAIRDARTERPGIGRGWIAGLALLAAGGSVVWVLDDSSVATGPLLLLLGAVLVVPPVLAPLARVIGRLTARVAPGLGDIAIGHVVHERRRSAYTLALVMVVLAMVLALGGMQTSITSSIDELSSLRIGEHVNVYANTAFEPALVDRLRDLDGAQRVTAFRDGRVDVVEPVKREVDLFVVDAPTFFEMNELRLASGDAEDALAALTRGGAVALPATFGRELSVGVGDHVTLATTEGPRDFAVVGLYESPETRVRLVAGAPDGARLRAAAPTGVGLQAADGVSAVDLERIVKGELGARSGYWVSRVSNEDLDRVASVRQAFRPFLAVMVVAGVVGMLGLANTLAMAVLRRTRELGVLRAVGIGRRQLAVMVLVESATLAGVALVLALALGWLLTGALLRTSTAALGFTITLATPFGWIGVVTVVAVAMAALAAVGPARRIGRLDPVVALRHEL